MTAHIKSYHSHPQAYQDSGVPYHMAFCVLHNQTHLWQTLCMCYVHSSKHAKLVWLNMEIQALLDLCNTCWLQTPACSCMRCLCTVCSVVASPYTTSSTWIAMHIECIARSSQQDDESAWGNDVVTQGSLNVMLQIYIRWSFAAPNAMKQKVTGRQMNGKHCRMLHQQ